MNRLKRYGITGAATQAEVIFNGTCTKNFLHRVNSDLVRTDVGVPYGSILGPSLFLLYINDILYINGIEDLCKDAHMYADDVSIVTIDKYSSNNELQINCNGALKRLKTWLNE